MNIFKWLTSPASHKWLKDQTGKLPISVAQAAGITAVVGAAGFAALNFLSGPSDDNNTFIPPTAYEQGDVVYVAQGPGSYDADGAAGSTFKAAPSRSIQLANRQDMQLRRAQELEEFSAQPTFEDPSIPASGLEGKAHALSGGEKGLGMGGNKQIGNSFEILKNMPDQLTGLNEMIASAQNAAKAGGAEAPGSPAVPGASAGGSAPGIPTLGRATLPGRSGGMTRAGGGSSSSNAFVVQDSGKNKGSSSQTEQAAAMAQAGDAIAQARAAMTQMREGTTLKAQANFGPSDRMSGNRNAMVQKGRNIGGKGANELAMIRKQSAAISRNKTNAANAGSTPFLSGEKISGGLVVSDDNVVIGQSASSGDLNGRSTSRAQMKGVQARLNEIQDYFEGRTKDRHELRNWMWVALPLTMLMIPIIGTLMSLSRILIPNLNPVIHAWGWACRIAAWVFAASTLIPIYKLIESSANYAKTYGGDAWSTFGGIFGGVLAAGVGVSLLVPQVSAWLAKLPLKTVGYAVAAGAGGAGLFEFLSSKGEGYSAQELDDNLQKEDENARKEEEDD